MSYIATGDVADEVGNVAIQSALELQAGELAPWHVPIGRGVIFGLLIGVSLWMSLAELIRLW